MNRPRFMRIDPERCIVCDLCVAIAPAIRQDPDRIRPTARTLDAMAECPTGAIVWREERTGEPTP